MLKMPGYHIGDSWYYVEGSCCHCFYLCCPDTQPRHTCWDIAHATSTDLRTWTLHGIVLHAQADNWENGCLSTGSVLFYAGQYWMAFTGRWNDEVVRIGIAFSPDLYVWTKAPQSPVSAPDAAQYAMKGRGLRPFCHWRDPYLFCHDGAAWMLTAATSKTAPADACGAVSVSRSSDMLHWQILPPVTIEPVVQELECPQIVPLDGGYVLLFSAFSDLFSAQVQARAAGKLRQTSYYMVSDQLLGPYRFAENYTLLPDDCTDPDQRLQYANRLVQKDNRWYLMGTVWSDAGDYLSDPTEVAFDPVQKRLIRK